MGEKTLRLLIDLTYDPEIMHGDDDVAIEWFNSILLGEDLQLGDFGDLGDMIGSVRVVEQGVDRIEELQAQRNFAQKQVVIAEAKLAKAVEALSLTRKADDLREAYHRLPNDKNRIGDKRSKKSHARDAWLRAFRKSAKASRATLAELTASKEKDDE